LKRIITALKIFIDDIERCDLFKHASAMAYATLFSLIPSLAVTFALISVFKPFVGDGSTVFNELKFFILQNLTAGSGQQLIGHIETFMSNLDMKKIGLTGFAGLLVTLVFLLRQIEIALNRIWRVRKPRNMVTRFVYFWTFLTLGSFMTGLVVGIVSGFDLASLNPFETNSLKEGKNFLLSLIPFFATWGFFTLLYKIVPNCFVKFYYAATGAFVSSLLLNIGSGLYGWFTVNFTSYQAIYGALAAIPLFLMWLYVLWIITLLGSLISWRLTESKVFEKKLNSVS